LAGTISAEDLARRYETVPADRAHARLGGLLPATPALVFDIGAGTGRDAAWLAGQGHQVVAIEPAGAMRRRGQELHPDDRIRWLDDRLPALTTTIRLGLAADLILLSAVWHHLGPSDRLAPSGKWSLS
jgi:SAM-dependent methyltransferase